MKILLVEDTEHVRKVISHILTRKGHKVAIARDATEAIALVDETFDVAIVDVVLGCAIGGVRLAKILRAKFSALRVIGMTGSLEETDDFEKVIYKPFDINELVRALEDA